MVLTIQEFIETVKPSLDEHPDITFIKDTEFQLVYVNHTYRRLNTHLDYPIVGKNDFEIFDEERARRHRTKDTEIIQNKTPLKYFVRVEQNIKQFQNFLVTKSPIFNEKDELIGILGMARNIGEEVKAKLELEENKNLLNQLMDSISYPIFIKNVNGKYIHVNRAFLQQLEMAEDQVLGKTDFDLLDEHTATFFTRKDKKVLKNGEQDIHISISTKDHAKYLTVKEPLRDSNNSIIGVIGVVNTYYDISQIQDQISKEAKTGSIAQLAAGIAHDLNNILTNVTGISSILLHDTDDDELRQNYQIIYKASTRAADLIAKLQTFAQTTEMVLVEINVNNLVDEVIKLVKTTYKDNIDFSTEFCKEITDLRGDRSQISQMIMNLIINGIEAMPNGGEISVLTDIVELKEINSDYIIKPRQFIPGKYARICIEDEGIGITTSDMRYIFDPYYTSKESGTGLGLAIVYGVIAKHQGLLRLISTPNEQTSFDVYLPLYCPDDSIVIDS